AAQVRAALDLSANKPVPVVRVSAKTGQGIEELWRAVAACAPRRSAGDRNGRDMLRLAQDALADRFRKAEAAQDPRLSGLVGSWQQGQLTNEEAGTALLRLLGAG